MSSCFPFSLKEWLRNRSQAKHDLAQSQVIDEPLLEEESSESENPKDCLNAEQTALLQTSLHTLPQVPYAELRIEEWLQRLSLLSWSHQMCKYKKLPNCCLQLQMSYFLCLQNQKPDLDLLSDQSQFVLCVALAEAAEYYGFINKNFQDILPSISAKQMKFEMIRSELSNVDTKIDEFSRQSNNVKKKLSDLEAASFEFLIVLRWSLPFVCSLPIRSQVIACLAVTEWLCDGRLIIAWELLCKLIRLGALTDLEQARIRRAINELITALTALPWHQGKWPILWFEQEIPDEELRQRVVTLVLQVKPLNSFDLQNVNIRNSAFIWLTSPSMLC